jgi:hypothetical protein
MRISVTTSSYHHDITRYHRWACETVPATIEAIRPEEVQAIKAAAPGAVHIAGGVHATGEPVQTLDAGWDVAAVGARTPACTSAN